MKVRLLNDFQPSYRVFSLGGHSEYLNRGWNTVRNVENGNVVCIAALFF